MASLFVIEDKGRYGIIQLNEGLDSKSNSALLEFIVSSVPKFASGPATGILLNMQGKYELDDVILKGMAPIAKTIKDNQSHLLILNATANTSKLIKEIGMDGVIKVVSSIPKALEHMGLPPEKQSFALNVEFINPFISSALETLKIQCATEATAGKPFVKGQGQNITTAIAAVLGLTSTPFNGTIALCFPSHVFLAIMGNMLGETYTEITKELEDGAGELLNIIFGGAKRVLNEKNYAIEKAIPTIIRGKEIAVRHMSSNPTIVLPFNTVIGPFQIEVATEPNALK